MSDTKYLSLEEIHAEELRLLLQFDAFCKWHSLKYSLGGGTLLGAVRHRGFIPWDDDIDLCMARPEWNRLVSLGSELRSSTGLLIAPYFGCNLENTPFVKIIDESIKVQASAEFSESNLWLDVMPVDGLPESPTEIDRVYRDAYLIRKAVMMATSTAESGHSPLRRTVKRIAGPVLRASNAASRYGAKLNRLATKIEYGSTSTVGAITWGMYGVGEAMPLKGFEEQVAVQFEGHELPCMSCWHEYLSGIYGDYTQLPPEDKRVTHGIKAWRV